MARRKTNENKEQFTNKLVEKVKKVFEQKMATIEDAESVIKFCNEYISIYKEKELVRLDEEIQKLTELKNKLQSELK